MNPYIKILLLFILTLSLSAETRTWTSDVGTKIEAELISFKRGEVKLRAVDGRILTVEAHRLSKTDQAYVTQETGKSIKPQKVEKNNNSKLSDFSTVFWIGNFMSLIGALVFFTSYLYLLFCSFRASFLWGISCFLIPCFIFIFAFNYWPETKKTFWISVIGLVVSLIGNFLIFKSIPI